MKRIGLLTSGGDAPGMNAAVRAVVRTAIYHGLEVMGIQRGYAGLLDGEATQMELRSVSGIINRGGTILRTARCEEFRTIEGRARAAESLKRFLIEGLVAIGGDGTYRGAHLLNQEHGVPVIGAPGTIDNDIGGTEYTIGFDTAVNTALDAIDRIRDTAASHDRLFIVEVMGRHCGALALNVGVAGGAEEILIPETPTDVDDLCRKLELGRKKGKTSSIIVVAEGEEQGGALAFSEKIKAKTSYDDVRVSILGHIQRGGSPTAYDRVAASRMGAAAVELLIKGETGCRMVGLEHNQIVTPPISDCLEKKNDINRSLVELAKILAI